MKKIDTATQKAKYPQSLASTNEASEMDRIQRIMNDPIENLIMASKSYNELRIGKIKKNRQITTAPPLKTRHKTKISNAYSYLPDHIGVQDFVNAQSGTQTQTQFNTRPKSFEKILPIGFGKPPTDSSLVYIGQMQNIDPSKYATQYQTNGSTRQIDQLQLMRGVNNQGRAQTANMGGRKVRLLVEQKKTSLK